MQSQLASDFEPDDPSGTRLQRLMRGASSAATLAHQLRMLDVEAAHRLALHRSHFNSDQPRVPAGRPEGGQWTRDGSTAAPSRIRLAGDPPSSLRRIHPDTTYASDPEAKRSL